MKQYEMFELSYIGKKPEESGAAVSQVSVDLAAEFTDAAGSRIVKGFYAGGGVYKIRFLPEHAGEVSYKVTGIISAEGKEICMPADTGRHGIVRAEGLHLKASDGTWFHSFGTTVYALCHQEASLTEETFKTLSENPFNKIRFCLFPKHYDYNVNDPEFLPFMVKEGKTYEYERGNTFNSAEFLSKKSEIWDVTRPNFAFWDAFEDKLKRLDGMGIQADLILFHPYDRWGFSYMPMEDNLIYLDYCLRRFSAFPNIWWSMANEYDLCKARTMEDWYAIEDFIAQNDPYHHLLSAHNCFKVYDFHRPAVTHCSVQKRTMNLVPEYFRTYGKPVLYDECVYEGNLKQTWGSLSGAEMMNRFWKVTVCGGYCTHGEVFLDMDMKNIDDAVLWWAKGGKLTGNSPVRIAFLREIIEEIGQPLECEESWLGKILRDDREQVPDRYEKCGEHNITLDMLYNKSDLIELARQADAEYDYHGHAGEDAYLYYYGNDCCARVDIYLPENHTYTVDVIDAWNMTRRRVMTGASGRTEVKLTGHEYMAVLAKIEK